MADPTKIFVEIEAALEDFLRKFEGMIDTAQAMAHIDVDLGTDDFQRGMSGLDDGMERLMRSMSAAGQRGRRSGKEVGEGYRGAMSEAESAAEEAKKALASMPDVIDLSKFDTETAKMVQSIQRQLSGLNIDIPDISTALGSEQFVEDLIAGINMGMQEMEAMKRASTRAGERGDMNVMEAGSRLAGGGPGGNMDSARAGQEIIESIVQEMSGMKTPLSRSITNAFQQVEQDFSLGAHNSFRALTTGAAEVYEANIAMAKSAEDIVKAQKAVARAAQERGQAESLVTEISRAQADAAQDAEDAIDAYGAGSIQASVALNKLESVTKQLEDAKKKETAASRKLGNAQDSLTEKQEEAEKALDGYNSALKSAGTRVLGFAKSMYEGLSDLYEKQKATARGFIELGQASGTYTDQIYAAIQSGQDLDDALMMNTDSQRAAQEAFMETAIELGKTPEELRSFAAGLRKAGFMEAGELIKESAHQTMKDILRVGTSMGMTEEQVTKFGATVSQMTGSIGQTQKAMVDVAAGARAANVDVGMLADFMSSMGDKMSMFGGNMSEATGAISQMIAAEKAYGLTTQAAIEKVRAGMEGMAGASTKQSASMLAMLEGTQEFEAMSKAVGAKLGKEKASFEEMVAFVPILAKQGDETVMKAMQTALPKITSQFGPVASALFSEQLSGMIGQRREDIQMSAFKQATGEDYTAEGLTAEHEKAAKKMAEERDKREKVANAITGNQESAMDKRNKVLMDATKRMAAEMDLLASKVVDPATFQAMAGMQEMYYSGMRGLGDFVKGMWDGSAALAVLAVAGIGAALSLASVAGSAGVGALLEGVKGAAGAFSEGMASKVLGFGASVAKAGLILGIFAATTYKLMEASEEYRKWQEAKKEEKKSVSNLGKDELNRLDAVGQRQKEVSDPILKTLSKEQLEIYKSAEEKRTELLSQAAKAQNARTAYDRDQGIFDKDADDMSPKELKSKGMWGPMGGASYSTVALRLQKEREDQLKALAKGTNVAKETTKADEQSAKVSEETNKAKKAIKDATEQAAGGSSTKMDPKLQGTLDELKKMGVLDDDAVNKIKGAGAIPGLTPGKGRGVSDLAPGTPVMADLDSTNAILQEQIKRLDIIAEKATNLDALFAQGREALVGERQGPPGPDEMKSLSEEKMKIASEMATSIDQTGSLIPSPSAETGGTGGGGMHIHIDPDIVLETTGDVEDITNKVAKAMIPILRKAVKEVIATDQNRRTVSDTTSGN